MGLTNSEKESNALDAPVLLSGYLYFILSSTLHSLQVKKIIENITVKNYMKESLLSILLSILFKERFFRKGFDPEIYFVTYGN